MESVGFKEWAVVCEALGRGQQSIILRKGGIAEGRDGFEFRHREFFLFPTQYHAQREKVRNIDKLSPRSSATGNIDILWAARVEFTTVITSPQIVEALEAFHIWTRDVIRERFEYDSAGSLHCALVRVYRLSQPWHLANEKRFGGCRSWVKLPEPPPNLTFAPVLTDAKHETLRAKIVDVIGAPVLARA